MQKNGMALAVPFFLAFSKPPYYNDKSGLKGALPAANPESRIALRNGASIDGYQNSPETEICMQNAPNSGKLAIVSLFTAAALLLSYIESLFPFFFGVPGMKLGLANLAVVTALYYYGWREALAVNILRVFLAGLLFGNLFSILFSLAGAAFSFVFMLLARKLGLSIYGVSMAGGVFHNIGQLLAAAFIVETVSIGYYAPFLLIAGLVTGLLIGVMGKEVLRRLPGG